MRACFKLSELVGTPACGGLKRRVVPRGPESRAGCRREFGSLVLGLLNKGKGLHVVSCKVGERTVIVQELECLIEANNDSILIVDGINTDGFPLNVTLGVLYIDTCAGCIAGADLKVSNTVFCPKILRRESFFGLTGLPRICGIVNGFVGVGYPLRAGIAVGIYITLGSV